MNAKRNSHSYKVKDSYYNKAMRRAKKEKGTLANLLECVVIGYAEGLNINFSSEKQIDVYGFTNSLKSKKKA